jgi:hypothetical protein
MNTKSNEQLIAIIEKQEEYIELLTYKPHFESGMNLNYLTDWSEKGRILREQIEALKK